MTHPDMRLVPVEPTWKTALLELKDKLWVARCNSSDEGFRACAERAIKMADEADWSPLQPALTPREEAPEGAVDLTEKIVRTAYLTYTNYAEFPYSRSAMREAIQSALSALRTQQPAQGEAVSGGTSGPSFQDVFLSWHEECGTVERAGPGAAPIGKFEARWPSFHKRLWKAAMTSPDALRDEWVKVAHECFRTASQQPADDKLTALQAFADEIAKTPFTEDTTGDDSFNALCVIIDYARQLSTLRPEYDAGGDLQGHMFRNPLAALKAEVK